MHVLTIDPVAFRLGPLEVRWYGLIIMAGIFIAIWLSEQQAKKFQLGEDLIIDLAVWLIPLGILGARLYYVLFRLDYYLGHPEDIFKIWEGGLAIYGGVIAGALVIMYFCKKRDLPLLTLLDIAAPHTLLAQGIGRWGNFVNAEAHGTAVSRAFLERMHLPNWLIEQMNIGGTYYQPTFLYESLWNILGAGLLMFLRQKKNVLRRGEATYGYMIWYGTGRFFIEGMRTDSLYWGTLRVSQWLSLILVIAGIALVVRGRFFIYPPEPYYSEGIEPERRLRAKTGQRDF